MTLRFRYLMRYAPTVARIAVLDDDEVVAQLLRTVIAEGGDVPLVGHSLDELPSDASPDLVVTDLIPLTAYRSDLARSWIDTVRARFPAAPIVIVTAHADAASEPDALGAEDVVMKPFDVETLLEKIRRLLARPDSGVATS